MQRLCAWRAYRLVPASIVPRHWRSWVLDRGSLTKRLIKASEGTFSVRVISQKWGIPVLHERTALGMGLGQMALIREVELRAGSLVWVRARSIIPHKTMTGEERQLGHLGTRPLGAFLFRSRAMKRLPIEVAAFRSDENEVMYGRRSVFLLHGKPLLVSELFLPAILDAPAFS